jgi:aryl-alcohol dehydrogenase-like predicted oxidoreductase
MSDRATRHSDLTPRPLSRRELLQRTGTLGAAGVLSAPASAQDAPSAPKSVLPTALLGRTGMRVSRLAFGGSWDIDQDVLSTGFELGINYFDTAESYRGGQSERGIGEFLTSRGLTGQSAARRKIWLVSKTADHRNMEPHLPRTLNRLQQDYLDCYYMHAIADPNLPRDPDVRAMAERMKKSGKIRFFGFSCHDAPLVACLNAAADSGFIDVVMFRYDHHYYPSDEMNRAMDRCAKANIGLVAMKTQVGGMTLPEKFDPFRKRGLSQHQAAVKAVAADGRVASICSEMTTVDMVQKNADAITSKLTVSERNAIREHARLISHLWCRGCDHICRAASGPGAQVAVADTLRFLMYHDHYGKREHARELFAALPAEQRAPEAIENGDWKAAESVCPYHVPLAKLMARVKARLA